jgi:dynein heavy chain
MSLLSKFYDESIHQPDMPLAPSKSWVTPPETVQTYQDYLAFIDSLPAVALPEAFGLHSNANLSKDQRETSAMFESVLLTERGKGGENSSGSSDGGKTREDTIRDVAADIASKVRQPYDLEAVAARFPVDWSESMNTVLTQELARYNRMLQLVHASLVSVQKAIRGLVLMSSQLEELGGDLFFGRVPAMWRARSYPSLKPLGGYVSDLVARLYFFDSWFQHGTPQKFWVSGFFFTQSFLTAALQNFARKYTVAIDEVDFDTDMLLAAKESITSAPTDGVYIYGMFLDGCRWDPTASALAESAPKALFSSAPVMWLKPAHQSKLRAYQCYECPMYVTSERRGILRTTGHSSNYVMMVKMPSSKDADHWIRRGVALLLQLDD